MATLEKIRNKAGLLVGIVGLALFAFIIGDFLNSGSTYFRQSQEEIAKVNGEVIKIQDYQSKVDEMTEVYKMQTGSSSLPEEYQIQIRQSVFDGMIQDIVMNEATSQLGLGVSAEELFDMVQGENISPVIRQMPMFQNPETGVFDKTALLNFLKTIEDENILNGSPDQQAQLLQARNFWLFWEKNIKRQRLEQKYTTLLSKAVSANKLDAKDAFDASATSSDILYTMQSYASIPDSTIEVSKKEIEKLYNQRKELFKQKESKIVKYLSVDIRPSQEDYDKANADIEEIKKELAGSEKVADIVNENSEVPYMDVFFSANTMDPDMRQFVQSANVGEIHGPLFQENRYRILKLVDKTVAPDSVKISHIMLAGTNETALQTKADSLLNVLKKGADFAALAKEFSIDQAAEKGGELGWFTEAAALRGVNEDFQKAVFSTPVNQYATVKSMYGLHIIKVTERTANVNKYKVADINVEVSPSTKTYGNIYNELNQFISKNKTSAEIDKAAREVGYNLYPDATVTAGDQMLGTIKNSRQIVRWAFQNKKGAISEIFECEDKFVIAAIEGSLSEGYRSLAAVTPMLKSELIAKKKGETIAQELASKNLTSVEEYAQAMGGTVDSVRFINFATARIAGIGVEPRLEAMVAFAQKDQLSEPVAGNNGVYVFKVYGRHEDAKEYDEAAQVSSLNASNSYRFGFQAVQSLINKASVTDNRIRFY